MDTRIMKAFDGLELYYDVFDVKDAKVAVQIVHGSIEHGVRYHPFAKALQEKGIAAYVMDQRGHGRSLRGELGVLSDKDDAWGLYVKEQYELTKQIKKDHPGIKVFMFGHSMGSFIVRDYLSYYSADVEGALLSGTGSGSQLTLTLGKMIAKRAMKKGRHIPNEKLHDLVFGQLDRIAQKLGIESFVSKDQTVIDDYAADPLCGFTINPEYAYALSYGLSKILRKEAFDIELKPILFLSGELDPVGGPNLKYVHTAANNYRKNGNQVDVFIYEDDLHEVLNGFSKEKVYQDIYDWIGKQV